MKKIIFITFIIIFILIITKEDYVIIPQDSIRFRVISNSNSVEDIFIKEKVVESILNNISIEDNLISTKNNIDLKEIDKVVLKTLKDYNSNLEYDISYGNNYFPKKIYNGVIYPEGDYESLVITLGQGEGNNFWCVLFPPLCMMENSTNTEDIEYKFKIKEVIDKFF